MRTNLKKARQAAGITQESIAVTLGISPRYYRMIESGERNGDFEMWDTLEDLFGIHQRVLRVNTTDESIQRNIKTVSDFD